jgi:hypothetical protein
VKLGGFDNDMSSKRILNVATPIASTDAATKAYVDSGGSFSTDVATLKANVATLQTNLAALTSIVNKLSTAPTSDNVTFWNSLRRERVLGVYGTTLVSLYYIPTAYIVGGAAPKITLSSVDYYLPRLTYSNVTGDPIFDFATESLSPTTSGYQLILPGTFSNEVTGWRQFIFNTISGAGFVWRRFS